MVRAYALSVTFLYDKQKLSQPDNTLSLFFFSFLFRCFSFPLFLSISKPNHMSWNSDFFLSVTNFTAFFFSFNFLLQFISSINFNSKNTCILYSITIRTGFAVYCVCGMERSDEMGRRKKNKVSEFELNIVYEFNLTCLTA